VSRSVPERPVIKSHAIAGRINNNTRNLTKQRNYPYHQHTATTDDCVEKDIVHELVANNWRSLCPRTA